MTSRTASRLAWSTCLVSSAAIVAAAVVDVLDGSSVLGNVGFVVASIAAFPLMGALIASRRPENAIGWIFCAIGLIWALSALSSEYSEYMEYALLHRPQPLLGGGVASWLQRWIWTPGVTLLLTFLLLLFPDGRLPSRRWRPVAWLAAFAMVIQVVPIAVVSWPLQGPFLTNIGEDAPATAPMSFKVAFDTQTYGILLIFVLGLASALSLIVRFRRARGDERAQIKWFALAGATVVIAAILNSPLFNVGGNWILFVVLFLPIAAAIAILRYRLYDIDVVISKAVVLGLLAVFITIVYGGIVVGVGAVVGTGRSPILSAIAAGVVAVAFQPVRHRAQRLANRVVYGKRATPYEVLSEFSERVGETYAAEDILPRMARILAEGTGAASAEVWLRAGGSLRTGASWPGQDGATSVPLAGDDPPAFEGRSVEMAVCHQGELLGALTVTKPPNEPLTPAEEKLVADLASQAGLVLRNVGLIADLRASRQRLVAAQDEERRRLERNLHDGAQQQLVGLAVRLRLVENATGPDSPVGEQLAALQVEAQDALENLRDLARGIYPPLLVDKGLEEALAAQARKAPVPVTIEADGVGRYPHEVEATVYFCCLEALQNVAKYAEASSARVVLSGSDGELTFAVEDDGRGFDVAGASMGTGLQGMADRFAALGGSIAITSAPGMGTTVTARIGLGLGGGAR